MPEEYNTNCVNTVSVIHIYCFLLKEEILGSLSNNFFFVVCVLIMNTLNSCHYYLHLLRTYLGQITVMIFWAGLFESRLTLIHD